MTRERYHLSIAVFVLLIKDNKLCMLRRCATGWMDGFYSLPAGGLEDGETLATAAAREAQEEVGVVLAADHLQLCHTLHVKTDNRSWMGHFFICQQWQGDPYIAEADKHGELLWVSLDQLPADTIPYVAQAVAQIRAQRSYSEFGW